MELSSHLSLFLSGDIITAIHQRKPVRPWWSPPSLLMRQVGSLILLAMLTGWKKMPLWVVKYSLSLLSGASGAQGMGCIGFPSHPVIELTSRCNLSCIHCHAGDLKDEEELSTTEVYALLDQLAMIPEFRMIAFTGGEPLLRNDLFCILRYAKNLGFSCTIASNGTLITEQCAQRLKDAGVAIMAISIDATDAKTHDKIRGKNGALKEALEGISRIKKVGIPLHINVTIASYNADQVTALMHTADKLQAAILIMYQLVPVGRGRKIADSSLDTEANQRLIEQMCLGQAEVTVVTEPVAGPQYWAYLMKRAGIISGPLLSLANYFFHGCSAGRGFVYIKPNGEVLPCPFLPISCGNIKDTPFDQIYRNSPVLNALRNRDNLTGSCGSCRYKSLCGGCRGRSYAITGDFLAEDPACFLRNEAT